MTFFFFDLTLLFGCSVIVVWGVTTGGGGGGGTRVAQGQRAACARGLAVADVGGVSVAERSVVVVTAAPTDHAAVVETCAGVEGAGADRDGGATGAETDGRAGHLHRSVPDRVLRAVAGPALEAEAPATDPTRVEDDAGMAHAGGDRGGGATETEVDDSDRGGRLAVADVHGVAVAEAPLESGSPALDLARVEDGARMRVLGWAGGPAGGDRHCGASAEVDRAGGGRRLAGVVAIGGGVAVAELTGVVQPPAADRAVGQDRAGVGAACAYRDGRVGPARRQVHRADGVRGFVVPDDGLVAVAERPVSGLAPALDGVVVEDRAVRLVADRNLLDRRPRAEVDRTAGGDCRRSPTVAHVLGAGIPEPPERAASPTADLRVVHERAGASLAGSDLNRGPTGPEVHRPYGSRRFGVADVADVRVVAELAVVP